MKAHLLFFCIIALAIGCTQLSTRAQFSRLDTVRERGELICGVSGVLPGFSQRNAAGTMVGFDADLCRAIAAAVLGDANKVRYVSLNAVERFTALADGTIDVLIRNTTWTLARDTALGLTFAGINYYDGQGFMVKRALGVENAHQLNDVSVCTQEGSTSQLNMADYFRVTGLSYTPILYESFAATREGFDKGECDVLTTDISQLVAIRSQLSKPQNALILPEVISKEPLGPVVQEGDTQWFRIVKWTLFALINAEEAGVTQSNIDAQRAQTQDPAVRRLLGLEGNSGEELGLDQDWIYRIIKQGGNYGELFERQFGASSAVQLPRGLNALWTAGGLMYAPPIR